MSKIIDVKNRHTKDVCLPNSFDTVAEHAQREFYRKANERENNNGFFLGVMWGVISLGTLILFVKLIA